MANSLFDHVAKRTIENAGVIDRAKDLGIDAIKAAIGLPESVVGLADIATGGRVGRWIEEETPVQFEKAQNILDQYYSEERQHEQQEVSKAFDESFLGGMKEAISQPAVPFGTIIQSLPQMAGGRAVAGGALKLAPKLSQAVAAGLGEGVFSAGSTAEGIRYENEARDLTAGQSLLAAGSGVLTGALGALSNKIGGKLGLEDIDVATKVTKDTIKENSKKSLIKSILGGVITEGILEELPQSTQEAIAMNLALGKEWDEGLSEAAGMGIISGGLMGGGINAKTNLSAKLDMAKLKALEKLKGELEAKDEAEVAVGLQEESLLEDTVAPREGLEEGRNEEIIADVDGSVPFGDQYEEGYEEEYEEEFEYIDPYGIEGDGPKVDNEDVTKFETDEYDRHAGISSADFEDIKKVETKPHKKLDEAIKNKKTKAIRRNGVYFVTGNQTKTMAANVNGSIAINRDKSRKFFNGLDNTLLGKNTAAAIDSFGLNPGEFRSLFGTLKAFNEFLVNHEKAHTFYGDDVSSVDAERRATYAVLTKQQRRQLANVLGNKLYELERTLRNEYLPANRQVKKFADAFKDFTKIVTQHISVYEDNGDIDPNDDHYFPEGRPLKKYEKYFLMRTEEGMKEHLRELHRKYPAYKNYATPFEMEEDIAKFLKKSTMTEDEQAALYEARHQQLIKEDRANSQYVHVEEDTHEESEPYDSEKDALDAGFSVKVKSKKGALSIDELPEARKINPYKKYKDIRKTETVPSYAKKTQAALDAIYKVMGKNKRLSLEGEETIPNTDYKVSQRALITEAIKELSDLFFAPDVINFIKREENVSTFADLDGFPDSLDELIGLKNELLYSRELAHGTKETNEGTAEEEVDELGNADPNAEFIEEHEDSVLRAWEARQEHDVTKAPTQEPLKGKVAIKLKGNKTKPIVTGTKEDIVVAGKKITTEKKVEGMESGGAVTVSAIPKTTKPKKKKTTYAQEERAAQRVKKKTKKVVKKAKLDSEAPPIDVARREENERKERERKQKLVKHVERDIEDNSIIHDLIDPFFEIIVELKMKGKYKAAAIVSFIGVIKELKKRNKAFGELAKNDPERADRLARKLIYAVNSLKDSTFNAYRNKQPINYAERHKILDSEGNFVEKLKAYHFEEETPLERREKEATEQLHRILKKDFTKTAEPENKEPENKSKISVINKKGVAAAKEAAKNGEGVYTLRQHDTDEHFGNPFTAAGKKTKGTVKTFPKVKDAVKAFKDWLEGTDYQEVEPKRRQWILDQIDSGKLDGKSLIYYKDLGEPSHADALADFINEKRGFSGETNEKYSVPENITSLAPNEVFVFGSNKKGIHGLGAAKLAKAKFGAKAGKGVGEHGQSYALPTKSIPSKTLTLPTIKKHVNAFLEHAANNPDKTYLVTQVGTGLAGYSKEDIAPMFKDSPPNVKLPAAWADMETEAPRAKQVKFDENNPHTTESLLASFRRFVREGQYSKWFQSLIEQVGAFKANKLLRDVWKLVAEQSYPDAKVAHNGTVTSSKIDAIVEKTGAERAIVGAHGIYLEFPKGYIAGTPVKPHIQYDEEEFNGAKVYNQTKKVNYAPYKVGKQYVAIEQADNLLDDAATLDEPNMQGNYYDTSGGFRNHSGGATGADTVWEKVGKAFDVITNGYYANEKKSNANTKITEAEYQEGLRVYHIVAKLLNKNISNKKSVRELIARNWQQVKNADAIYAVGTIDGPYVSGGTGYAVAMATLLNKPIFVYDQTKKQWYQRAKKFWVATSTPTLTNNFAGIGTREINDAGKKAIKDVYEKTFNGKEIDDKRTAESLIPFDDEIYPQKRLARAMQEETKDAIGSVLAEDINSIRVENGRSSSSGEDLNSSEVKSANDLELFLLDDFTERASSTDLINRSGRNIYTVIANIDGKAKLIQGLTSKDLENVRLVDPTVQVVTIDNLETEHEHTVKGRSTEHRRYAKRANNNYEVSTKGDKRFSALNATLKDGRTIEEAYQLDVKGYRSKGNNWKLGKGKDPINDITRKEQWEAYKALWEQFFDENPDLYAEIVEKTRGKTITDWFTTSEINQARAIAEIITERSRTPDTVASGKKVVEISFYDKKEKAWTNPVWVPYSEYLQMKYAEKVKFKETGREKVMRPDSMLVAKWDNTDTIDEILKGMGKDPEETSTVDNYEALAEYAKNAFKQSVLANKSLLDALVKEYGRFGITKADLADVYVTEGSYRAVQVYISRKMQEHYYGVVNKLYAAYKTQNIKQEAAEYVTARMSKEEKAEYEKFKDGKTKGLNADKASYYKACMYLEDRIKPPLTKPMRKAKQEATKKVEKSLDNLASIKFEVGLPIEQEDIFKPTEEYDETKPFVIGELTNKAAQKLYTKLAAAFGAELLVVNHNPETGKKYKSRYVPNGPSGKPTIIINISEPVKFSNIFAHELFHHIVNKSSEAEYKAFTKALSELATPKKSTMPDMPKKIDGKFDEIEFAEYIEKKKAYEESKFEAEFALKNEEIQAELFADLIYNRDFYDVLSKSIAGKSLAARLVSRLLNLIGKLQDFFMGKKRHWVYDFDARINMKDMDKAYELFADLIGHSIEHDAGLRNTKNKEGRRYYTPIGDHNEESIDRIVKNKKQWLKGVWNKVFPKGTRTRKGTMDRIENMLYKFQRFIAEHKPNGLWADFMVDKTSAYYAMLIQNEPNFERWKAKRGIINPNKHVFTRHVESATPVYLEKLRAGKLIYGGKRVSDSPKNAVHKYVLKNMQEVIMEDLYDHFARGRIDLSTEEGIKEAQELGYSNEVIHVFQLYKETADKLYAELKKVIPSLRYNPYHYGLSLKWYFGNAKIYNSFDSPVTDEMTQFERSKQLGGPEQFVKTRDMDLTTAEIKNEYGIKYKTIDPHQMFEEYVSDAKRLINLKRVLQRGSETGHVEIFEAKWQADEAGMLELPDDASKILIELDAKHGYRLLKPDGKPVTIRYKEAVYATEAEAKAVAKEYSEHHNIEITVSQVDPQVKAKVAYYIATLHRLEKKSSKNDKLDPNDPDYYDYVKVKEIGKYATKSEADAAARKAVKEYSDNNKIAKYSFEGRVSSHTSFPKEAEVGRYYFKKDLHKMLSVILKEDKFRNGSIFKVSGNHLLSVKNAFTSWQFAFSMFHGMTIGQELMASYATWSQMRKYKGIAGGFNIVNAWKESREITALVEAALTNSDFAKDPAIVKRANELLGTTSIDVLEAIRVYANSGGLIGADEDLKSGISSWGDQKYTRGENKFTVKDGEASFELAPLSLSAMKESLEEVYQNALLKDPTNKVLAALKTGLFASMESTTAWLMGDGGFIRTVKLAMWMREYTLEIERRAEDIKLGRTTKEEIGRMVMKFIEDRFGETNWKNMWMDPTFKSLLQFTFRSFTWIAGSWKALSKSGISLGKKGWFKLKGENIELTAEGRWGLNAVVAHFLAVGLITAAYQVVVLGGGDEVPDDEETPLLTRLLFPRNDRFDPYSRVAIPSYITELYKIMQHTGAIGGHAEPFKLVSGRVNSLITNTIEALVTGEDWRGVSIRDTDDNYALQAMDTMLHIVGILPISVATMKTTYKQRGMNINSMLYALLGMTDAPAAAKRSLATNVAFAHRRKEFKGRAISDDEMDLKDDIKRAAYMYGRGNKKPLLDMLHSGRISKLKFKHAIQRIPLIDGHKNPAYKNPLYVAVKGLTIESALDVWNKMSENEKKEHRSQMIKKYRNVLKRKDKSGKEKILLRKEMKAAGVFGG